MVEDWGPGYLIAERYRLVEQLGRGGMGSVWVADHMALQSKVAIKLIDPAIANSPEALDRFMREAKSAASLRSPHVVQTFDYGIHAGVPYIAMELLEGENLAGRLARAGRISIQDTARILTQVGRAITRAHEAGIVHRDLKPDNVFLVHNEDEELAKVVDFGIAKTTSGALGNSSQTRTGAILGTPYYMSPEQAEGNKRVDHRTDLWALAVITFECVVGQRPFESEALGDLVLRICVRPIPKPSDYGVVIPGFDAWFAKATERDPALRFQTARELTDELRVVAGLERGAVRQVLGSMSGAPTSGSTSSGVASGGVAAAPALTSAPTPMPLAATNFEGLPRRQAPLGVILGATAAGFAIIAALVVFALKRADTAAVTPSTTAAPAIARTAAPAPPAVAPAPPAVEPAAASATPPEPATPATEATPAPETPPSAASAAKAPKQAVARRPPPKKATAKPAASAAAKPPASAPPKRVDFGF